MVWGELKINEVADLSPAACQKLKTALGPSERVSRGVSPIVPVTKEAPVENETASRYPASHKRVDIQPVRVLGSVTAGDSPTPLLPW
jgi:hypothetical protein